MKMKEQTEKESTVDKRLVCVKITVPSPFPKVNSFNSREQDYTDLGRAQRGYLFANGHTAGRYQQDMRLLISPSKVHVLYQESTQKISKSAHQPNKTNAAQEGT